MTSFKRLTRGIKLLVEHVFDPIASALTALTASGLPVDNYEKSNGTFRINLSFPLITKANTGAPNHISLISAPFILPALQDKFTGTVNDIENYELTEVSIGQDTKTENGSVNGIQTDAAEPAQGTVDYNKGASLTVDILSHKIDSTNFDSFGNSVFTISLPDIGLINPYNRMNPHVQAGLSVLFDHTKSYLVKITVPEDTCRVSLNVSLKFKTKLTTRDESANSQNAPATSRNFTPQSPTVPAGDTTIKAGTNVGVNTNLKLIDDFVGRKLRGGFNRRAQTRIKEGLSSDMAYEVIAVPMFGGQPQTHGGTYPSAAHVIGNQMNPHFLPWSSAGAGNFQTMDRALVALQYPIAIHHVIIASNYTAGNGTASTRPSVAASPNLTHNVGVGLISGYMSDHFHVEQVANASWTPATIGNYLIDRGDRFHFGGTTSGYSWDLLQCPLTGAGGTGYKPQGKPIYAATGNSSRTALNGGTLMQGGEQYLDIRWKISDGVTDPASYGTPVTITGFGGSWIYIICKKTLR